MTYSNEAEEPDDEEPLRAAALRSALDLAVEFRVPIVSDAKGGELTVRRETASSDRWAVTNGSLTKPRAWTGQGWESVREIGLAAAYRYSLDDALDIARNLAEQ